MFKKINKCTSAICVTMLMFNFFANTGITIYAESDDNVISATEVTIEAGDIIGTWEGTYCGNNSSSGLIDRNYRIEIDKCTEDGKIEGYASVESGKLGEYWFDGNINYETGEISFEGTEWYNNPQSLSFASFKGFINPKETNISGFVSGNNNRAFSLDKISDTYITRRINIDEIPLRWNGEYDGTDGSIVVRRNFEVRVQEVEDDGSFNGTAFITPSDLAAAEYSVYGSYYIEGEINERTGKITAQGYEWIERPSDNFKFVDFSGYIDGESYCIEGQTDNGIWDMKPVEFEYYDMCGTWVGYYTGYSSSENIERNLRLDIDKCLETGKIEGVATIDDGELGRYIFDGTVDFTTGTISFTGVEWLENTGSMSFAIFDGKLDTRTLTITGNNDNDSKRPFYLRKISDTYNSLRIDINKLPRFWQGKYDGHSDDIVVRRDINLLITSIDENGEFEGEMTLSPSEDADPEYGVSAKYKLKGSISIRTGKISLQGYEWLEEPVGTKTSNFGFAKLNGYINSLDYSIAGDSERGIWIMNPAEIPMGDINADRTVSVADCVILQNFLLGKKVSMYDWTKVDFDKDGRLSVFDFILLKKVLIA